MTAPTTSSPGVAAIDSVVEMLAVAGIEATRDPGSFYPQPIGVLVGLPTLTGRTHRGRTFEVAVLVVSGDPANAAYVVDRMLALADDVALALRTDNYRPSSWRSSVNAEPLPAFELTVTVTTLEEASP